MNGTLPLSALSCFLFLTWEGAAPVRAAVVGQSLSWPLGINTNGFLGDRGSSIGIDGVIYGAFWVAAPYGFDLDGNGTPDITFTGDGSDRGIQLMRAELHGKNQVWSISGGFSGWDFGTDALSLLGGTVLGSSLTDPNPWVGWHNDDDTRGHSTLAWLSGIIRGGAFVNGPLEPVNYLGVRFERDGAVHYGWMGLSSLFTGEDILVHQWAWETEPGKGILVGQLPEPSGVRLGLLTAGLFLAGRRRVLRGTGRAASKNKTVFSLSQP